LFLPDVIVSAYYAKVPGASNNSAEGGYTFKCSAELSRSYPRHRKLQSHCSWLISQIHTNRPSRNQLLRCPSGQYWRRFGDVFLKSQFVVFNATFPPRTGFAPKLTGPANELIHPSDTHKTFAFLISCQSESRRLISPIIQYIMSLRR